MAERVGVRGGAVRPNRIAPQLQSAPVAAPTAGGAASTAWAMLARSTEQVATVAHARHDRQVAAQATDQGILDAIMGRVRRLDRSTTRGGAYMDAALSTTKLTAETNAIARMAELYREFPNDPAALQGAINDYAEGAVGEVAALDPGTAVELRARIVTSSIPMINGAVANREQTTARAKQEAREIAEREEQAVIGRNADDIFSEDAQQSQSALAAILDSQSRVQSFRSEEAAEGYLLSRLSNHQDASHVVNMEPELKTRLAALIDAAPDNVKAGLGIYSGYRSIARQKELWEASDKTGHRVARPGHSQHNHGNAADLSFNGKSLEDAPDNVREWVHDHAAEFGLTFPMSWEPWHIETQEARGGEAFTGTVGVGGAQTLEASDQPFRDAVLTAGFRSWFSRQTDKTQAYLDFSAGKIELPMTLPTGEQLLVNVRKAMSENAAQDVEANMRAQLNFETSLIDRAEAQSAKELEERSEITRAGYMTGILAPGTQIKAADGSTMTFTRPTEADLLDAHMQGLLDPGDYETLLTALHAPPAVRSDENVKREAFRMIVAGEDPQAFLLENLSLLTAEDAKQMLDYYGARSNEAGTLNASQKFYIDQLEDTFAQGFMDEFDTSKQERKVSSVIEARDRMLEGEDPKAVYEDIAARAKFVTVDMPMTSPPFPRPRFFVPAGENQINVEATFNALEEAFANQDISDADYVRQKRLLMQWDVMQQQAVPALEGEQ